MAESAYAIETLVTAEEAERRRLAALTEESIANDIVQIEVLYRERWVRFEISVLEVQHLPSDVLWRRYLTKALSDVRAPAAIEASPATPDVAQAAMADIGGVDS